MERLRQTKYEYEKMRSDYEKDEDYIGVLTIKKREEDLKKQFKEIIRNDRNNAEVIYRNGYYLMEKGDFLEAIRLFENSLSINKKKSVTYPLDKAQEMNAHMFIGYCAGHIVKNSLAKVNELNVEEAQFDFEDIEGKSLDEVLEMLKNQSEHYLAFHNGEKRSLSLEEYLKFKAGGYGEVLLISFIEPEVFIKVGANEPKSLSIGLSEKLRFILKKIIDKGNVNFVDLKEEYGENKTWRTFNRTMSRINEAIVDTGLRILEIPKGTFEERHPQKMQLATNNYIIVFRQSDFAEEF